MEQAVVFGKYEHLVGIKNILPEGNKHTAFIMMTSGMLHNVGPYRMYVDIANSLAEQGISSLRFDLSGIGDSLGVGTAGKSIKRAAFEASEAMTYLTEKYGFENFIVFGLCSGADDSIQTALEDKRVKGVINLDGLGYTTWKFQIWHKLLFIRKLFNVQKLLNKVRSFNKSLAPVSLTAGDDIREFPETPELASKSLQQLVDRNVRLHFIYTGGTYYYNYYQQFYDMLPDMLWKNTESTVYFPHLDHIATLCEDREELIKNITDKTLDMIQAF